MHESFKLKVVGTTTNKTFGIVNASVHSFCWATEELFLIELPLIPRKDIGAIVEIACTLEQRNKIIIE